jgi:hypothetical protein
MTSPISTVVRIAVLFGGRSCPGCLWLELTGPGCIRPNLASDESYGFVYVANHA